MKVRLPDRSFKKGLVQVYTGDGKGKTTAALGLALRALGQGLRVYVIQFMKGVPYGELNLLRTLPDISIIQFGNPQWVDPDNISEEERLRAQQGLDHAKEVIHSSKYDIVILDELTYALTYGWLPIDEVLETIGGRPEGVHVVITGRDAPTKLIDFADLVTEMREIKHPFQQGLKAQPGIEF